MGKYLDTVYKKQSLIYKYFLYFLTVACIVFFFPRGGKFKYEFQKGKPWQYENLYAPFDFTIKKSTEEISLEEQEIESRHIDYYSYDPTIVDEVKRHFDRQFEVIFPKERYSPTQRQRFEKASLLILENFYRYGLLENTQERSDKPEFYLVKNNEAILLKSAELPGIVDAGDKLGALLAEQSLTRYQNQFRELFFDILRPNVRYDDKLTKKALDDEFSKISMTRGSVDEGKLIVAKGEVVEAENLKILSSLKAEYESELWTENNLLFIISGYTILVALVLMMLMLFLKKYRPEVWRNNVKVTFIFFNILLMVFVTTLVVKYNEGYVFVVPLCILPLILKTFFDARLGLFVHVLTVLILGFVVPNSFEYIFLQIIAGIVTILTVSELYKRANLFISVGQITLIYMVGYFAFYVIQEGSLDQINLYTFGFFLLNGMITLFAQPLIYVYEKIFGLISDVSLLELSDTNSRLLKELANKAPGTFHHSLQVANLAEASANEIGANAMLVRVGALYHDIGKMNKPAYFTENQVTNINPHDDLQPRESARIIIDHVIEGIEIARQNRLPDRVIDFIRTHHGTTNVYYFYKKQQDSGGEVKESDYRYP
ncbi:MAG: HDIG domain-containing metalloprotein, partial [Flavobacteriaceae bacterium]